MRPKANRQYKGKGNRHNRFKRDTKKLAFYANKKDSTPAGFIGFRWQT